MKKEIPDFMIVCFVTIVLIIAMLIPDINSKPAEENFINLAQCSTQLIQIDTTRHCSPLQGDNSCYTCRIIPGEEHPANDNRCIVCGKEWKEHWCKRCTYTEWLSQCEHIDYVDRNGLPVEVCVVQ